MSQSLCDRAIRFFTEQACAFFLILDGSILSDIFPQSRVSSQRTTTVRKFDTPRIRRLVDLAEERLWLGSITATSLSAISIEARPAQLA
ncbi:hypothetical protein [Agrobacterium cavarae]